MLLKAIQFIAILYYILFRRKSKKKNEFKCRKKTLTSVFICAFLLYKKNRRWNSIGFKSFGYFIFLVAVCTAFPIAVPRTAHTRSSTGAFIPAAMATTVFSTVSSPPRDAACSGVKVSPIKRTARAPKKRSVLSSEPEMPATRSDQLCFLSRFEQTD